MALFLLIAAVWAVFLLPPLWAGWYYSPTSSTRRFSRLVSPMDDAPLPSHNTYRSSDGPRAQERDRKLARRRQVLFVLASAAFVTLVLVVAYRNIWMLILHVSAGAALVWYTVMLRRIKVWERRVRAVRPRVGSRGAASTRYRPERVASPARRGVR